LLQCNKEMYAKEWGSTTNGSTAATCVTRVVGRNIYQHARGYCKRHEKAHEFYLRRISDARKLLISPNDGYSHGCMKTCSKWISRTDVESESSAYLRKLWQ
jgi:hypothetical protein